MIGGVAHAAKHLLGVLADGAGAGPGDRFGQRAASASGSGFIPGGGDAGLRPLDRDETLGEAMAEAWNPAMGRPNWTRSKACSRARRNIAWQTPTSS